MDLRYWRLAGLGLIGAAGMTLAGCDDYLPQGSGRSEQPISSATLAEMTKIDTTPSSPVLIRTYKKEAELEIWKMKSDGHYALLKTYPMCRWSGQLGPKKREGDMQVPEGFYTITPGQMNPNSNYYLAFNVGYPNAYDRAYNRTGANVMVHGVCSSAGCFSMTDEQVADIYAVARDAFRGGQRQFQLQSYPFRMNAENLAKYRLDPNIAFWKEIKKGSDYFEVAKVEPSVTVCNRHYVFGATPKGPVSATAACPALDRDETVAADVAEKEARDESKAEQLANSGVKAIRTVYADGGQNPLFVGYKDTSDPEALMSPPQEVVLEDRVPASVRNAAAEADEKAQHAALLSRVDGLPPSAVRVAEADAKKARAAAATLAAAAAKSDKTGVKTLSAPAETASVAAVAPVAPAEPQVQTAALVAPAPAPESGGVWGNSTRNVKKWLNLGGEQPSQPAATALAPTQLADPAEASTPPRRSAQGDKSEKVAKAQQHSAAQVPAPPAKPADAEPATAPAQ